LGFRLNPVESFTTKQPDSVGIQKRSAAESLALENSQTTTDAKKRSAA
jgi:hypothetical protein